MSTEIKNTLFRFVTMRAPELLEKEKVQKTFAEHPDLNSSFFNAYLSSGTSKKESLKNAILELATLETTFKSREELKIYADQNSKNGFFAFASWLTANRRKFTLKEIEEKLDNNILGTNLLKSIDFERKIILWDNLIYQIITSKSNYIREGILSVLVASLFLENRAELGKDIKALRKLAQARVLMPKEIFSPEKSAPALSLKEKLETNSIVYDKPSRSMEITLINHHMLQLKNMANGVSSVEKRYRKENERKLQVYKSSYDLAVEEAYEKATKIEKVIIDPVTKEEITIIEYENLILPKFDFIPENEMDYLVQYLDGTDYFWLIDNCKNVLGYDTFSEIIGFAKDKESKLMEMQFERTSLTQKYKNSGGMLFPIVQAGSESVNSTFALQSIAVGTGKKLVVEFDNIPSGTSIQTSAAYNIHFSNSANPINGSFAKSEWVANKFQVTLFGQQYLANNTSDFRISGTLTTQTGDQITFSGEGHTLSAPIGVSNNNSFDPISDTLISDFNNFSPYLGDVSQTIIYTFVAKGLYSFKRNEEIIIIDPETGNPADEVVTNPSDGVIEYIPSGFGIKRLGIADYRKVEQEVCCYVPGEVSHIENVMASEYKERATRRLRRTEDTTTTSKEKESEKLTDSTSTDRFEMNSEVASVLAEDTRAGGFVSLDAKFGNSYSLQSGADFANNTSSEESNSQAVTHAKEVTERVLDRVVQKIKEERVSKIVEEFEENNKHGFDNRNNDQHVSGVYRWVDKIYKNKVVNYGKRLMYEFMIPEPASFHKMTINENDISEGEIIEKPIDPRIDKGTLKLSLKSLEDTYQYWAEVYNVAIDPLPTKNISIGTEFAFSGLDSNTSKSWSEKKNLTLPEGYKTIEASVTVSSARMANPSGNLISVSVGNLRYSSALQTNTNRLLSPENSEILNSFEENIPISVYFIQHHVGAANVIIKLGRTDALYQQWQIETFNAIIKAYETKLQEYNAKVRESKAIQTEKVRTNPLFYRQIESMILRKNCIEYLVSHKSLGENSLITGTKTKDIQVSYADPKLEAYATKVKFFEQAFEWELMSYNFYPFYWAHKENWLQLYNVDESEDAIFKAFLQSGMARIILTIRPGFEEAVNWYMATGQVWNGGQVPTIDDELFISIVEELRVTEGEVEETWETRVPTSLTIIQAGSIGMVVPTALPCDEDCKDYKLFDSDGNPKLDAEGNQINTNPFKIIEGLTLKGNTEEIKN